MKLRKITTSLGLAFLSIFLVTGCSKAKSQDKPQTKQDAVNVIKHDLYNADSAQETLDIDMATSKQDQDVKSTITYSKAKNVVMNYRFSTSVAGKVTRAAQWMDEKYVYTKSSMSNDWGKIALSSDLKKDIQKIKNNKALPKLSNDFYKKVAQDGKLTTKDNKVTLKANITDRKFLDEIIEASTNTSANSRADKKSKEAFESVAEGLNLKNIGLVATIKNNKLTDYKLNIVMNFNSPTNKKKDNFSYTLSMDCTDFNQHNDLKVPTKVKNAEEYSNK